MLNHMGNLRFDVVQEAFGDLIRELFVAVLGEIALLRAVTHRTAQIARYGRLEGYPDGSLYGV